MEPICAGRVLIAAFARAIKCVISGPSASGAQALTAWLQSEVVPYCLAAARNFQASSATRSYQPMLFQYFYLSFLLHRSVSAECAHVLPAAGLDDEASLRDKVHPWLVSELNRA